MKKLLIGISLVGAIIGAIVAATLPAAAGAEGLSGGISLVGSSSVQPLAEELAKAFMAQNPKVNITVAGGGSGAGIKAARTGQADIGTCSRELTAGEEQGLTATVIARDGIAIIVHPSNMVATLTVEQIKLIYTGEIKNWKQVGGAGSPIVLVSREAGSGTRGAFEELVLGKNAAPSADMLIQGSTGAVRQTVAVTKNAIGYISMGAIDKTIKPLRIEKVEPNEANVLNKTYPLSRPFLFLTKGAPKGLTKSFIDWILSPQGQAIVAKEYVAVGKTR